MIHVDYKDRRPIYEQVIERMQDLMVKGILEEGEQLPSVRSLATDLSINPNTIQRAYAELERLGYIYSVKGKGSFVTNNQKIQNRKKEEIYAALDRLSEQAVCLGIKLEEWMIQAESVYKKQGSRKIQESKKPDREGSELKDQDQKDQDRREPVI